MVFISLGVGWISKNNFSLIQEFRYLSESAFPEEEEKTQHFILNCMRFFIIHLELFYLREHYWTKHEIA